VLLNNEERRKYYDIQIDYLPDGVLVTLSNPILKLKEKRFLVKYSEIGLDQNVSREFIPSNQMLLNVLLLEKLKSNKTLSSDSKYLTLMIFHKIQKGER